MSSVTEQLIVRTEPGWEGIHNNVSLSILPTTLCQSPIRGAAVLSELQTETETETEAQKG